MLSSRVFARKTVGPRAFSRLRCRWPTAATLPGTRPAFFCDNGRRRLVCATWRLAGSPGTLPGRAWPSTAGGTRPPPGRSPAKRPAPPAAGVLPPASAAPFPWPRTAARVSVPSAPGASSPRDRVSSGPPPVPPAGAAPGPPPTWPACPALSSPSGVPGRPDWLRPEPSPGPVPASPPERVADPGAARPAAPAPSPASPSPTPAAVAGPSAARFPSAVSPAVFAASRSWPVAGRRGLRHGRSSRAGCAFSTSAAAADPRSVFLVSSIKTNRPVTDCVHVPICQCTLEKPVIRGDNPERVLAFARVRFAIGKQNPVSFNSVSSRKEQRSVQCLVHILEFSHCFPSIFSIDFSIYY